MISQSAEYALRAAVHLATIRTGARTTQAISRSTGVPPTYLSKLLALLGRSGLVHSQRGPKGGFFLARVPEEITALDIVNAVDPLRRLDECPLGLSEHREQLCPLHARLSEASALIEKMLRDSKLSDLLTNENPGAGCRFPGAPTPGPDADPGDTKEEDEP